MIRRRHGGHWLLITQDDHAQLSGQLARHIGNEFFAPLSQKAILGISMHDAGWPIHDEQPTLNSKNLPLDVFETPREIGVTVWAESTQRAAEADPYAGLLVSLHSLALSAMPVPESEQSVSSQMKDRFETNKFQHKQIEEQEKLRHQLGMQTDIPLALGLAKLGTDPADDQLIFDFRWLQALDQLSLIICCSTTPLSGSALVHPHVGQAVMGLSLPRAGQRRISTDPWPFNESELSCTISGRLVPDQRWPSVEDFRRAYANAPIEEIDVTLRAEQ
ncbi:MAG TPA: DUF3891 family protein [Tepidisphaeraceae bacterium]|nr:DUF3891 family protein [Tepidisphaeraceae bacterium]